MVAFSFPNKEENFVSFLFLIFFFFQEGTLTVKDVIKDVVGKKAGNIPELGGIWNL